MSKFMEKFQAIGRGLRKVEPVEIKDFPTDRRWTLDADEDGPTFGIARKRAQEAGKATQEGEI